MTFIYSREGEKLNCYDCGKEQKCMNVIKSMENTWISYCRKCKGHLGAIDKLQVKEPEIKQKKKEMVKNGI